MTVVSSGASPSSAGTPSPRPGDYGAQMATHAFRITVRGAFTALTPHQRAELLADAVAHDVLSASFTPEGHVSYDVAARPFFTFRFAADGDTPDDLAPAVARAVARARTWLDERGYEYKNLAATAEDLADLPPGKRGRRALTRRPT